MAIALERLTDERQRLLVTRADGASEARDLEPSR